MKYLASEIVKRAMDLADISNTDFLSVDEHIHYINDSWREFYQMIINKGDTQFVKEVYLAPGSGYGNSYVEYALPSDLYQISSIVVQYSGEVIPRKSDSESSNSKTYEIVNDHLRLYGVGNTDIVLRYYTVPEFITIPDKTITCDYSYELLDNWDGVVDNCILSNETVTNLRTGEIIATDVNNLFSLAGGKLLFDLRPSYAMYYDFDGNAITSLYFGDQPGGYIIQTLRDKDNMVWFTKANKKFVNITGSFTLDKALPSEAYGVLLKDGERIIYEDNANRKIYLRAGDEDIYLGENPHGGINIYDIAYNTSFGDVEIVSIGPWVIQIDSNNVVYMEELPVKGLQKFNLKYGPCYYDGNVKIASALPDTEFNFPNELYVQVLSASLAIKYAMKQNASVEGLNNLYENYKSIFKNSLSQDSGYTRITNVYRA